MGDPRSRAGRSSQAQAIRQKLVDDFPQEGDYQFKLAIGYRGLLVSLATSGSPSGKPWESGRRSIAVMDSLVKEYPREPNSMRELSEFHNALQAFRCGLAAELQEATAEYRKSLEILIGLVGDDPTDARDRQNLEMLYHNLDRMLGPEEMAAREGYGRQAIRLRERLLASDFPNVPAHQHSLAMDYDLLAVLLNQQHLWEQAEKAMAQGPGDPRTPCTAITRCASLHLPGIFSQQSG